MKKNLLTVLVFIIISSPIASAFSHCSSMPMSDGASMPSMMDMALSNELMMDHQRMQMDTTASDCDVTMDCAAYASVYISPHAVEANYTDLLLKLSPFNGQFPQSANYSPEIKPPCLVA